MSTPIELPCFAYGWIKDSKGGEATAVFNDGLVGRVRLETDLAFGTPLCAILDHQGTDAYLGHVHESYPLPPVTEGRPRAYLDCRTLQPPVGFGWIWSALWTLDERGYDPVAVVDALFSKLCESEHPLAEALNGLRQRIHQTRTWGWAEEASALDKAEEDPSSILVTCDATLDYLSPFPQLCTPEGKTRVHIAGVESGRLQVATLGVSAEIPPAKMFTERA